MNIFHKFYICCFLVLTILSCSTPEKAIEKGKYVRAMNLAAKKIVKGDDIQENENFLKIAADSLASQTLQNYKRQNSNRVEDWKGSQSVFYRVLEKIGNNNIKTNGLISESYDMVCEVKHDLDLRIIDYYYEEAKVLLSKSIRLDESKWARQAYYQFLQSEKEGANKFYTDLEILKQESIINGTIIVDAPRNIKLNSIFLKSISDEKAAEADCVVNVREGLLNFSKSSSTSHESVTKEIIVGQEALTDTSGVTTYKNIMKEIVGHKRSDDITYTLTQVLDINVRATNAECYLKSRSVNLIERDECTEIVYSGDKRVFTSSIDESCSSMMINFALEHSLKAQLNRNLFIE